MTAPKKAPAKRSPAKRAPAKPAAEALAPADQGTPVPTDEAQAQDAPPSTESDPAVEPTKTESDPATQADSETDTSAAVKSDETAIPAEEASAGSAVPEDDDDGEMEIPGVWVTSKPKSFRRAGYRFTQEGFGIALHALKSGQLKMLENDPSLVVEHVTFTDVPLTKPKAE